MKIVLTLVITSVVMATEVAAQSGGQPVVAVSAIDKISPQIQPLAGTLFLDPLERDRMDRARKTGSIVIDDLSARNDPPVMNGFVKRSDGRSVIWIDSLVRYNIQSARVDLLQPSDVGNESVNLSVREIHADRPLVKSTVKKKHLIKKSQRLKTAKRKKR